MIIETIEKKKRKEELDRQEITEIIEQYVQGRIPDYQMSALLMAIWFQGMSMTEITALTTAMMKQRTSIAWYTGDVGGSTSVTPSTPAAALAIRQRSCWPRWLLPVAVLWQR